MINSEALIPIEKLAPLPSDVASISSIPGRSFGLDSQWRPLPENGQVYVEMNAACHTRIPRDRVGQIFTTALAGCTGIAAIGKGAKDTLAGVSHFDEMVDTDPVLRTKGACPSESFMNRFMKIGSHIGAQEFEFHIAYATMHEEDPAYGNRDINYSQWHFLDQLQTFSEGLDVGVTFHPYEGMNNGHTLVVNVDLDAETEVQFK